MIFVTLAFSTLVVFIKWPDLRIIIGYVPSIKTCSSFNNLNIDYIMENWQIGIIKANLVQLTSNTTCSPDFLNKFCETETFSQEDVDELSLPIDTPSLKSSKFYRKIVTRKRGFTLLMKNLKDTKQTGASSILATAITRWKHKHLEEVDSVSFDKNLVLGKGSNGTVVFKGRFGGREVAVKRVNSDTEQERMIAKEIENLKYSDSHENIVRYYGTSVKENFMLIVLELCNMTLNDWLLEKRINISPVEVLRQITVGLNWLHSMRIVHRDLKPENILLKSNPILAKISDFGLSRNILDERNCVSTFGLGTQDWNPPEILQQYDAGEDSAKYKFSFKSDIFSLGCVYYFVLTDGKHHPFGSPGMRVANILTGKYTIDYRSIVYSNKDSIQLIKNMIINDPQSRPSCPTLLISPLFSTNVDQHKVSMKLNGTEYAAANHKYEIIKGKSQTLGLVQQQHKIKIRVPETNETEKPFDLVLSLAINANTGERNSILGADNTIQLAMQKKITRYLSALNQMNLKDRTQILMYLIMSEKMCIIQSVLERVVAGGKVKITEIYSSKRRTMLHYAVERGDYDIVEYLINALGFEVLLHKPRSRNTIIHDCMYNIHQIKSETYNYKCKILELLFTKQPLLIESKRSCYDCTSLHEATRRVFTNGKQLEFIKFLLKHNADVNAKTTCGNTPLHWAVRMPVSTNVKEIIHLLIKYGADEEVVNKKGYKYWHKEANDAPPDLFKD